MTAADSLSINGKTFVWGARTYLMAIVNVSPESFSGDGIIDAAVAAEQGRRFVAEGADFIDVGGQSTRPGFEEITVAEETSRVVPVIRRLRELADAPISVDTYRAEVAAAALDAGAAMVNDISGFRSDTAMAPLVASRGAAAVIMHNQRGHDFHDVASDILDGFRASLKVADAAGLDRCRLIVDPGFGFGWTLDQNLEMLRRLSELKQIGLPILVGTSRKSTIGSVIDLGPEERTWGTAATVALSIANGADIIRVHDVREMAQVARMTDAIVRGP
jgi:dihydropteroate synthase